MMTRTMVEKRHWSVGRYFVLMFFVLRECNCQTDVTYEGRNFVLEGASFNLSCVKSLFGAPKWTLNGLSVDPLDPQYIVHEEVVPNDGLRMTLRVRDASWRQRGEYKCDPLSSTSHRVEVVPTRETDEEMRTQKKVLLKTGRTIKLLCDQEENAVFPINWYKDFKRLQPSEEDEPRIRMEGRTLWVTRSTWEDAGEYVCIIEEAGLSYPFAEHLGSRIKITYPARVEMFQTQMRPILHRNWSLECKVQGFPVPRISWTVDGVPIEEFQVNHTRFEKLDNTEGLPDAVLSIRDMQWGDDHVITCSADNLEGSSETATRIVVRESAIITNEDEQGKGLILTPGHDLVIQCNNTDDYSTKVIWLKNGQSMNVTGTRISEQSTNTSLIIRNAVESDCGNYTCRISGKEAVVAVRSNVRLGPVEHSRNVVQNQNIILSCNVTQGTPLPTLQWLKDNESLNMSDPRISFKANERGVEATELTIADARFEDRAEYTCIATNEISSVNATILVRVKDKYAALWPFLGICAEVAVLCTIIFIYEKKRQKPDFDESETEHNTENKTAADQEEKNRDVRQRK